MTNRQTDKNEDKYIPQSDYQLKNAKSIYFLNINLVRLVMYITDNVLRSKSYSKALQPIMDTCTLSCLSRNQNKAMNICDKKYPWAIYLQGEKSREHTLLCFFLIFLFCFFLSEKQNDFLLIPKAVN